MKEAEAHGTGVIAVVRVAKGNQVGIRRRDIDRRRSVNDIRAKFFT